MTWTYRELFEYAQGVAEFMEERGVEKGDRAILWASNSPYWLGAFFGCLLRGVVVVPMHTENTPEFIRKVIGQTEPKIFFKSSDLEMEGVDWVGIESLGNKFFVYRLYLKESRNPPPARVNKKLISQTPALREDDIAEILYTSGTTGEPKGVMLTHKNLASNINAVWDMIPIAKNDRVLSILPLSHIFEQAVEFRVLAGGAFIVYAPALGSSIIKKILKEYQINKFAAVPEFLKRVMSRVESEAERKGRGGLLSFLFSLSSALNMRPLKRLIFSSIHKQFGGKLELIVSGGAMLDTDLARKWQALGVRIVQGYGLTETSSVVSLLSAGDTNVWSVGKIVKGVEVKIAADREILVRGPNVMKGYYKNEEATRSLITKDGWLRTGDLGHIDKNGYLYIRGRKKFMLLTASGQNVYPEDIETELNKEPEVKDSAVVGLEKDGKIFIHAELLGDIKNAGEVVLRVNKRLASFQQIQSSSVWPFEDFPRTITRKVKRHEVLEYKKSREAPARMRESGGEKSALARILADVLEKPSSDFAKDTRIVSLGLDSLARIELVARIEEEFGVEIDETQITPATTVAELEKIIEEKPSVKVKYKLRGWPRHAITVWVREILFYALVRPLYRLFAKVEVGGLENIKGLGGPVVFMPNHISDLDGSAMHIALPRRFRRRLAAAAATDVLFEQFWYIQPFLALLFNVYPFPRRGQTRLGFEYTGELMDKGWSILIFPEGRIYPNPQDRFQLMEGAGVAAVEMRSPVVPVRIEGADDIMPRGKHFPQKRGKVTVRFGKPMCFDSRTPYKEATRQIREAFKGL